MWKILLQLVHICHSYCKNKSWTVCALICHCSVEQVLNILLCFYVLNSKTKACLLRSYCLKTIKYFICIFLYYLPQFSVECGILSQATQFVSFRGICMFSRNFVEFSTGRWYRAQIWNILMKFTMTYITPIRALMGGILEILSWAYLKYWQFIW